MKKQNEQRLVPKLRFKGFSEDWEQRKLKDMYEIIMGQSPLSKNYTEDTRYDILVQGNADLKDGKVIPRIYTKQVTKLAKPNSIIFTVRAPVGQIAINTKKVVIGRGVCSIEGDKFLYHKLEQLNNIKYWNKFSTGSTFDSINSNDLKNMVLHIPKNIEEKNRISHILDILDSMITLHNLKKEKIEKLKLDLVRRLDFSLTEESDEVVLGDLIEIKSGYSFKSEEFSNNGIPLVRISDIDSGIVKKPDTFIKEDSKHIDFLIQNGDYLIAMSGATTGKVGRYTLSHDAYCNQRIGIIRGIENKIDNNYLEYVLHSSKFQHYISTQWGAGAQPNINLKQIKDYKLKLPKLSEQKLIGSIFTSLNSQKDLHKVKVEQLLSLKEIYLKKLFI